MKTDFHIHSCHSDGALSVSDLIGLARQRDVGRISITDHDCVSAYGELSTIYHSDIEIIPGCEFSSVWRSMTIHVLGLNLDLKSANLSAAINNQTKARDLRAHKIAEVLEKKGLPGSLEGALQIANGGVLGRPHFAQFMVDQSFVKDRKQAFKKYLGAGKVGDVKAQWPNIEDVCEWIVLSGGIPVLAHPLKYGLTQTRLKNLLVDFKEAGGLAIEVISGAQDRPRIENLVNLAEQFDFHASLGSDFHQPDQAWADLGLIPDLPAGCQPVWQLWG